MMYLRFFKPTRLVAALLFVVLMAHLLITPGVVLAQANDPAADPADTTSTTQPGAGGVDPWREVQTPLYDGDEASCGNSTGGGNDSAVSPTFSLGTEDAERRVNFISALMSDYGLTPEQAAGVAGNFMAESGGPGLPPDINEGGVKGPPAFDGGYGWAQWTAGRQRTFIDFAVAGGYMASDQVNATDAANYAYLKHEFANGYESTITELKTVSTPEDAAVSFERTFERAGVKRLEVREANARIAFEDYAASSGTGSSCGAGTGACVNNYCFPLNTTKSVIQNPSMFSNNTTSTGGHPYIAYDILVPEGTEVVAYEDGTVNSVSTDRCGGTLISIYNQSTDENNQPIDHTITYMHLSPDDHVAENDTITKGQHVGKVGPPPLGCDTAHLHIDAIRGASRLGCSRNGCPQSVKDLFEDIGPRLYETFQLLQD